MGLISVSECPIAGLYVIEPTVHKDSRGEFLEVYNYRDLSAFGIDCRFVQENQNRSKKGVLRGLHYQKEHPQAKLARVTEGRVFDVAVDLRAGSESFRQWYGVELSAENHRLFYVPEGFAHGMLTLSETAVFAYLCTDYYHPGDEGGIMWNDPDVGVKWPGLQGSAGAGYMLSDGTPVMLSEKDRSWPGIKEVFSVVREIHE